MKAAVGSIFRPRDGDDSQFMAASVARPPDVRLTSRQPDPRRADRGEDRDPALRDICIDAPSQSRAAGEFWFGDVQPAYAIVVDRPRLKRSVTGRKAT